MPRACPHCSATAVHAYLHGRRDQSALVWLWCSSCRSFIHASTRAPTWWQNLGSIDAAGLGATPVHLDEASLAIDRHWAQLPRARSVSVVEIRKLIPPSTRPVTSARFVLLADGTMIIVGRTPEATQAVEELTAQGVPGPGGTYIKMDAGMEFLRLLAENFRGSRLWATTVFEMEEDKALEISPTDA